MSNISTSGRRHPLLFKSDISYIDYSNIFEYLVLYPITTLWAVLFRQQGMVSKYRVSIQDKSWVSQVGGYRGLLWWVYHWHENNIPYDKTRVKVSDVHTTLSTHPFVSSSHPMLSGYEIYRLILSSSITNASLSDSITSNFIESMTRYILGINIITHDKFLINYNPIIKTFMLYLYHRHSYVVTFI